MRPLNSSTRQLCAAALIALLTAGSVSAFLLQRADSRDPGAGLIDSQRAELEALQQEIAWIASGRALQLSDWLELSRVLDGPVLRQSWLEGRVSSSLPREFIATAAEFEDALGQFTSARTTLDTGRDRAGRLITDAGVDALLERLRQAREDFQNVNAVAVRAQWIDFRPASGEAPVDNVWTVDDRVELAADCRIATDQAAEWSGGELSWTISAGGAPRPLAGNRVALTGAAATDSVVVRAPVISLPAAAADQPVKLTLIATLTPRSGPNFRRVQPTEIEPRSILLRRRAAPTVNPPTPDNPKLRRFKGAIARGGATGISQLVALYAETDTAPEYKQEILWHLGVPRSAPPANPVAAARITNNVISEVQPPQRAASATQLLADICNYKARRAGVAPVDLEMDGAGELLAVLNPPLSTRDQGTPPQRPSADYGQVIELCRSGEQWIGVVLERRPQQREYSARVVGPAATLASLGLNTVDAGKVIIALDEGISGADLDGLMRQLGTTANQVLVTPSIVAMHRTSKWSAETVLVSLFWCARNQVKQLAQAIQFKDSSASYRLWR